MEEEAPIARFMLLSWHWPNGTDENRRNPQQESSESWLRCEQSVSQIQDRNIIALVILLASLQVRKIWALLNSPALLLPHCEDKQKTVQITEHETSVP
jgi:hypothetical protein